MSSSFIHAAFYC